MTMPARTLLQPVDPVCSRAIALFVRRLAASTPLRPRLRRSRPGRVALEGERSCAELCVEWLPSDGGEPESGREAGDEPGGSPGAAVRFHIRTLEALARNIEASRALVKGARR